jgi:chromate transporter
VAHLPFPAIVLAAGVCGLVGARFAPAVFAVGGGGNAGANSQGGPALIDDDTPTPAHARFAWPRFVRIALVGLGVWGAALGALTLAWGWSSTLPQMGWFFTKAALLTFGGAYAVLPYVFQGAVTHFQWLSAPQMIDGLALGETTPGPLIMVVAFVGFVGGWTQALFGPQATAAAGIAAACVATFFTFLPSFVFIFLGGPFIESTQGQVRLTAPLTAISAAVVGVIANLAVFFAVHVLWPQGWGGGLSVSSALIGLAAAVAAFRFKVGVIPLIAGGGLAGMALRLWG